MNIILWVMGIIFIKINWRNKNRKENDKDINIEDCSKKITFYLKIVS